MGAPTMLFQPLAIGTLTLKNRIVMPPMTTLYDYEGGARYGTFLAERAGGGAAMITVNLQALYPGRGGTSDRARDGAGATPPGPLAINRDACVPRLRELTRALHEYDCKVCAQLAIFTPWAPDDEGGRAIELSPSGVRLEGPAYRPDLDRFSAAQGRPAEIPELHRIQRDIARAAARAIEAGFDGVQVQALSGNLLSRFLSPLTNVRTDAYGGGLANRARMLTETITGVRRTIGPGVPLLVRINGDDLLPGGMTPADYQQLVPMLEDAGVDAIDVMAGWYETRTPVNHMSAPRGAFVYVSEALKGVARVPVSANVRITDPGLAERILQDGQADFIAVGTPLIADPEWPDKTRTGRSEDIRLCTACCYCLSDLAGHRRAIGCSVNARAGQEATLTILPAPRQKHVVVVGGGPAGMEAARVAALRGHHVTLFEARPALGGQLRYADAPPHAGEWQTFVAFLETQLRKLCVDVRLGVRAGAADVRASGPDAVIVATGAGRARPEIPGANLPHVVDCADVLAGVHDAGRRVVLIGGGSNACATAAFLAGSGRLVTLVDPRHEPGLDVDFWNRWLVLDYLEKARVRLLPGTRVVDITPAGVRVASPGRPEEMVEADSVVCAGCAPHHDVQAGEFERLAAEVYVLADSDSPDRIRHAVEEGHRAGNAV